MQRELHPWNWFAPENSRVLIVGTFPPTKRNWSFDFFYPNKNNFFWKVIAQIAEKELEYPAGDLAVEERKNLLRKLHLAVTDMGQHISRNNNSSLDENLSVVEYMNIFQILDENPTIRKIIFTSSSGKESAVRWFIRFLASHEIKHRFPTGKRPIKSAIEYKGRMIELVILYSTSPRAANRITLERLVELYKNEILL
jgi:G:T/U-mismatch repair DNA glycosylase